MRPWSGCDTTLTIFGIGESTLWKKTENFKEIPKLLRKTSDPWGSKDVHECPWVMKILFNVTMVVPMTNCWDEGIKLVFITVWAFTHGHHVLFQDIVNRITFVKLFLIVKTNYNFLRNQKHVSYQFFIYSMVCCIHDLYIWYD